MSDVIEVKNIRAQCDECGHKTEPMRPTQSMVGMECPECASVMITQGDYDALVELQAMVSKMNEHFAHMSDEQLADYGLTRKREEGTSANVRVQVGDEEGLRLKGVKWGDVE